MTSLAACAPAFFQAAPVRTLADAQRGQRLRLGQIHTEGALGDRLMELGLVPGTEVAVLERGLFGGHLRIDVRGSVLPLHRDIARSVEAVLLP